MTLDEYFVRGEKLVDTLLASQAQRGVANKGDLATALLIMAASFGLKEGYLCVVIEILIKRLLAKQTEEQKTLAE